MVFNSRVVPVFMLLLGLPKTSGLSICLRVLVRIRVLVRVWDRVWVRACRNIFILVSAVAIYIVREPNCRA